MPFSKALHTNQDRELRQIFGLRHGNKEIRMGLGIASTIDKSSNSRTTTNGGFARQYMITQGSFIETPGS
jgi:hypothetical protein